MVTLRAAAEQLGVHYMTAYRHVRTGSLMAVKRDGRWWVDAADLAAVAADPSAPPPPKGSPGRAAQRQRLRNRLLAGDEAGAWTLVELAMASGASPTAVYLELLAPVLRDIGEQWAAKNVSVAQEHQATSAALRLMGRLGPRFTRPGRTPGTLIVASAPDDHHTIPAAMVADIVRARGFDVVNLGGATPPEALAEAVAASDRLLAVGISVGRADNAKAVRAAARAARAAGPDGLVVLIGGPAVRSLDDARRLGADGWAVDAAELVGVLTAS